MSSLVQPTNSQSNDNVVGIVSTIAGVNDDPIASLAKESQLEQSAIDEYNRGNFSRALEVLKPLLEARREMFGDKNIDTLRILDLQASIQARQQLFIESEATFRFILNTLLEMVGPYHATARKAFAHLAAVVKIRGELTEAKVLYEKALECIVDIDTQDEESVLLIAECSYDYGVLLVQLGLRTKAEKFFKQSHEIFVSTIGASHPHTLDASFWSNKCADAAALISSDTEVASEDTFFVSKPCWKDHSDCEICHTKYDFIKRRHHCRICSRSVCDVCSQARALVKEFGESTKSRICSVCEQQGFV